ncbi:family 16 glycosylhydrolase [Geodermatophilus normandii]|uniref:Family 16 glycosylhydrolase n=1 Tax=Geodermatophilus normandii TaxID=1137989 RepID=A0A6P0GBS6_9ACTN|nr:family 16 glycosylhydrolase [Geodermatophilus normandii]
MTAGTGGSRFDLRGFRALNHGYAGVSVDGGPETRVNYYGTRGDGVRWSTTLAAGAHTIKVRVLGTRDPRSSGTLVNVTGAYLSNGSFGAATTPTPTPTPTPAPVTPPTFEENFDRAAPLGSFRSVYSNWGHYDGTAPGDTSRRGTYDTARTTSVADGIFRQRLHHATDPQGRAHHYVSAVLPPIAGGGTDAWSGQLYGTFETRVRVTDPSGTYKMAWLLWPNTDDWADGEIDWPEADNLAAGTRPRPASKQLGNYNSVFHPATTQYAPAAIADGQWHVYRTVWSPTSIQFWQDDTLVATVTDPAFIPRVPMRWVLQSETNIGGSLSTTDPAVIEADYVRYRAR